MEKNFLEIAKRNLEILQNTSATEQDVKRLIVEPIMLWSGIDIYDPNVLREEYPIQQINNPTRADYAILINETPQIAIEAKNISEDLNGSLRQLIGYCNFGNIRFGLITNGKEWWFIDETWKDSQDRVFLRIALGSDYTELIKLMNPYFSDILEAFAEDYRNIQNGRIVKPEVLYGATIKEIRNREDQKRSQPENTENEFNVTLYFSDILEAFAEDYRNIQNGRIVNPQLLFEGTIKKIKEIEAQRTEQGRAQPENSEPLPSQTSNETSNEFNVTLSQFLDFVLKKNMTNLQFPGSIMLGGNKIEINSWRSILINLIRSCDIDKLLNKEIRYSSGSKYHLITLTQEVHDNHRYFKININGKIVYVYTSLNVNYIIKAIDAVKSSMGLPNDYIKFPDIWFKKHTKELKGS